jgi:hypothetical protein
MEWHGVIGAFSPELKKSAKPEDLPKVEDLDLQLVFSKGLFKLSEPRG